MATKRAVGPAADPLALVLTGGGARTAYQVGVLAGLAECGGNLSFPIVTGVSAGAINAAFLASHPGGLRRTAGVLERMWLGMSVGRVFRTGTVRFMASLLRWVVSVAFGGRRLVEPRALLDTRPLRKTLARAVSTEGIEANIAAGRLRALALSAVHYATGDTVTFVQGAHDVPLWRRVGRVARRARIGVDHLLASCALPLLFPAIEIEGEFYGDGSLRLTAPLAPAIHLGAGSILAIAIRAEGERSPEPPRGHPPPAQVLGMIFNAIFLDALDADLERLERINRLLQGWPAGVAWPEGLRPVRHLIVRPSRDLGELAADLLDRLPGSVRLLARGLGAGRLRSADLLSYLLFERSYIGRLIELGRNDARRDWQRIAAFLEASAASSAAP